MKSYIAKSGAKQFKPSMSEVMEASEENRGFCLACGESQDCVEPDARRYECECCGKSLSVVKTLDQAAASRCPLLIAR